MCRKYAVPREEVELQGDAQEECNANDAHADLNVQDKSCVNGHMDSGRRCSMMGGVDVFASPDEKENANLPSVSLPLLLPLIY